MSSDHNANVDPFVFGTVSTRVNPSGEGNEYFIECSCALLNDRREIASTDLDLLIQKIHPLIRNWSGRLTRQALERPSNGWDQNSARVASERAQRALAECETLLKDSTLLDHRFDWNILKFKTPFVWKHGAIDGLRYDPDTGEPQSVIVLPALRAPVNTDVQFVPKLSLIDHIIPARKRAKIQLADASFSDAMDAYEAAQSMQEEVNSIRSLHFYNEVNAFSEASQKHEDRYAEICTKVDRLRASWMAADPAAMVEHAELVLDASRYPGWFNPRFELAYLSESKMLVVDYQLPDPEHVPTLERVTYVKSRNEITEKHQTEAKAHDLYDAICYQVALRSIHELFASDEPAAIDSVTFNGWVEATSKSTGQLNRACILSVQAFKGEFLAFNLGQVNAKACFTTLKGVAASSLSQLAPVRPVIRLERNDSRFIDSRDVVDSLDQTTNLAAMNWEDFEHLVRELFGKVFSSSGTEVRVTQASRDGGVDAVVLDPDPIKGGKIVIQAKRYTDTVGVGAVRDLYGTVMNEGANRGILVTTSNFGPDAYKFANGKPLTLLNGANLLSLLAEHGQQAKIDLAEAKRLLHD